MKLYLIRHGKSLAHDQNKRQSPDTPLGELGIEQSKKLAQKIALLKIDNLFSSDWKRALQTAEIISKSLNKQIVILDKAHEKEQSPDLYGVDMNTSEIHLRFMQEVVNNEQNIDWKFDGKGETLREAMTRIVNLAQTLATDYPDKNIALVTHGNITKCLLTSILLEDRVGDEKYFFKVFSNLTINYTGISLVEYFPDTQKWRVNFVNDCCHLLI